MGRNLAVTGASLFDWEDLTVDTLGRLWISDTGDNWKLRSRAELWVLPLPAAGDTATGPARRVEVAWPGNKAWNIESLFCRGNDLYVLTKTPMEARIFRLAGIAGPDPFPEGTVQASDAGSIPVRSRATGADLSPDGSLLVVTAEDEILLYSVDPGAPELQVDTRSFRWRPWIRKDGEAAQIESVAFRRDGSILIANEGGEWFLLHSEDLVPITMKD